MKNIILLLFIPMLLHSQSEIKAVDKNLLVKEVPVDLSKATTKDLRRFEINVDKFTKITTIGRSKWYSGPLKLFIKISDERASLVLRTYLMDSEWVFTESIEILCGGSKYEYVFINPEREVLSGSTITEQSVIFVDEYLIKMFSDMIANPENCELRFNGSRRNRDKTVPKANISDIRETLDLFNKIKV